MLNIITHPNPILVNKTKPVSLVDAGVKQLIAQMRETMLAANGIGLAANQVGQPIQLAIIENNHPKNNTIPFTVIINPKILSASREVTIESEGCLSLPKIFVKVPRSKSINISTQDENGNVRTIKADGLFSRVIQHEIDHLNGILITDYGEPEEQS